MPKLNSWGLNTKYIDKEMLFKKSVTVPRGFYNWSEDEVNGVTQCCWMDREAVPFCSGGFGARTVGTTRLTSHEVEVLAESRKVTSKPYMQQGPGRPRPRPFPRGSPGIFGAGNLARKFGDLACIPEEIFLGSPVKISGEFLGTVDIRQHFPNHLPSKTKRCNFFLFTTVFL